MRKKSEKILHPQVNVTANRKNVHYTADYIINPVHPITVNIIGCGGTGSQVINSMARMNSALKALGHPGLFIRAIDPDKVTEANMGRQLFSPADINSFKCVALIGRVNRFFGTDWDAVPSRYTSDSGISSANITISCVDTGAARKEIKKTISSGELSKNITAGSNSFNRQIEPYKKPYYWLDFGNMNDRGQAVMGTVCKIRQPEKSEHTCVDQLPTIDKIHPEIFKDTKEDDQGPSCSLAEALQKQDLFINTNLANMGLGILWKMFRELHITHHGCYLNLKNLTVNPIKI